MAIRSFRNRGAHDIAFGVSSKRARSLLPDHLHEVAYSRLHLIDAAFSLEDLRMFRGLKLEKLLGDRSGQFSIRINNQYRICFYWYPPDAADVEIVDYH